MGEQSATVLAQSRARRSAPLAPPWMRMRGPVLRSKVIKGRDDGPVVVVVAPPQDEDAERGWKKRWNGSCAMHSMLIDLWSDLNP